MVDAVLPQLAKSQPFIERQRRIEHLHVNADPLSAARAFGEDVLEDAAADTGFAVLPQQRDVDDADLPLPPGDIQASDRLAIPEADKEIATPGGLLVHPRFRVELGAQNPALLAL